MKKIMILALVGLMLITLTAVAGANSSQTTIEVPGDDNGIEITTDDTSSESDGITFTATGKQVAFSQDALYGKKLSTNAKNRIKEFKNTNKKNPVTYNITISEDQYNTLLTAKNQGKTKEIQIKTDQYIIVKKPVVKKSTKTLYSNKYYKEASYKKALKKLRNKYEYNDDIKIKVITKWKRSKDSSLGNPWIINYKQIKVIKTVRTVTSFKTSKEQVKASLVVNNKQNDGKDWVYFFVPSLGIDGTIAKSHITIV